MTATEDFLYDLPAAAISQQAIEPRDSARLLNANTLADGTVADLPGLLQAGDLIVVNSTKVRAARLHGTKRSSGGSVEVLLLGQTDDGLWEALIRPARRIRAGALMDFDRIVGEVRSEPIDGVVKLRLESREGHVDDLLPLVGEVPLPPYFHGALADDDRYQTMFAKAVGSAAAPTAGLHFTPRLAEALTRNGISIAEVELEVGLDTFRPIATATLEDHAMHREQFHVPEATAALIDHVRGSGGRVVAVGTTVVRTLESAANESGSVAPGKGDTGLFIVPGYEFRVVDAVLTNFHAPGTTLIVLIAAILGERWRRVYAAALERGYRFLSFGDAMFIDNIRTR
jgi:S-adenosylmethionine:tRNA ribosyltransferase-isomerase